MTRPENHRHRGGFFMYWCFWMDAEAQVISTWNLIESDIDRTEVPLSVLYRALNFKGGEVGVIAQLIIFR